MSRKDMLTPPADSRDARLAWRLSWVVALATAIMLLLSLALMPILKDSHAGQAPRPASLLVLLIYALGVARLASGQLQSVRRSAALGLAIVAFAAVHWLLFEPATPGPPGLFGWPLISEPWLVVLALGGALLFAVGLPEVAEHRGTIAWTTAVVLLAAIAAMTIDGVFGLGARTWPASGLLVAVELALTMAMTAALFLYGRSQMSPHTRLAVPTAVGIAVGLFSGLIWLGLIRDLHDGEHAAAREAADSIAAIAVELLETERRPIQRLVRRIGALPADERGPALAVEAERLLEHSPGIFAMAWFDADLRPVAALGEIERGDTIAGIPVPAWIRTQSLSAPAGPLLGPSVSLDADRGRGALLLIRAEIPVETAFMVVGLRFDRLFSALPDHRGLRILDGPHTIFGARAPRVKPLVELSRDVHGREWRFQAWPVRSGLAAGRLLPTIVLVAGLAAAAALAASLQLAERARRGELATQDQLRRYIETREALDSTERRMVQALESTSDALFILNRDWCFSYLNAHAGTLLQRDAGTLLGRKIWDEFPAARGSRFEEAYAKCMRDGTPQRLQEYYAPLEAWFEVRAFPHPEGLVVYFRDITEQRNTFDRVVRSEAMLARTQHIARLGGWELDIGSGRLTWTDETYRLFGIEPDEFGASFEAFFERVHPDDRDRMLHAQDAALRGESPLDIQHRIVRPDGEIRWIHERAELATRQDGARVLSGTAQDITELQAGRQAIIERDRFFNLSLECFSIAGLDGHFRQVNPAFTRVLGHSAETLLGRPWVALVHPDDVARTEALRASLGEGQVVMEFENRFRGADGNYRWLSWTAQPAGDLIYSVARDVTERKEMEARLNRTLEDLKNRNRELEEFAFVASHDLQEPLRKIRAFSDRLASGVAPGLDERSADYLNRIAAAASRMQRLIDDLLAYSRVSTRARPFRPVDLGRVTADALADLEARVEETGAVIKVAALPSVLGDETQLRQVMQNLLGNALKFVAPGRAPRITVAAASFEGGVAIMVEDNGIGFDPSHAERIFSPFQRLHARHEYEGSGIGLAIVRRIMERHAGRVEASSMPGAGAVFRLVFPGERAAAERAGSEGRDA